MQQCVSLLVAISSVVNFKAVATGMPVNLDI